MVDKKAKLLNTSILVAASIFIAMYFSGMVYAAVTTNRPKQKAIPLTNSSNTSAADSSRQDMQLPSVTPDISVDTSATPSVQKSQDTQQTKKSKDREDD